MRVAVAGVGGIGKHHAKWHHAAGAEVVGILGTTEESCTRGAKELEHLFPFCGRTYTNWSELLRCEAPDVVDICLPNKHHYEFALEALNHGTHVLCEKPLVWASKKEVTLLQARSLVDCAKSAGRLLGVCSQYSSALPQYLQILDDSNLHSNIKTFYAEMDTFARGRSRTSREVWIDMGPHPLSLLLALIPEGRIENISVSENDGEVRAKFDVLHNNGCCACEVIVRDRTSGRLIRRFGINGLLVDCTGRNDEDGVYRSILERNGIEYVGEDFMSAHIKSFIDAAKTSKQTFLTDGEVAVRNLELQNEIFEYL